MKAVPAAAQADTRMSAEKRKPKGISHLLLWGALGMIIVLGGAIALGVGGEDGVTQWVRDNVPGLAADPDDGWVAWEDPDGVIYVPTPGELSADGQFPVPGMVAYTSEVGNNELVTVGYTTNGYNQGAEEDEDANIVLLEVLAENWADAYGAELLTFNDVQGFRGNRPYLDVQFDGVSLTDGPAFGNVRLMRVGDEMVFVQTIAYPRNPDSHARMVSSLELGVDRPTEESDTS